MTNDTEPTPTPVTPGYPASPWLPPTPAAKETDGFSIAALVLGILPVLAGVLGIVFGIIAIRRTAGGQRGGRGMAIAGVICGCLWMVGTVVYFAVGANHHSTHHPAKATAQVPQAITNNVDIGDLRVGDCIANEAPDDSDVVTVVTCSQPHEGEVYATFPLGGSRYPGDADVDRFGSGGCEQRLPGYVGKAAADNIDWDYNDYTPDADIWASGDHHVVCTLSRHDGQRLVGSQRANGVARPSNEATEPSSGVTQS